MGCSCSDSVEEKDNQRKVNSQTIDIKKGDQQQINQKEKQNKKEKEEVPLKRDIQIVGPLLKLPEDNIELVSFTEKTMDLKKMRELELMEHNYLRSLHGAEPLVLNEELNEMAQNYAKKLAKQRNMQHSKERNLKGKEGEWVGENLYCSNSSKAAEYVCGSMSKSWYSEIKDYDFKTGKSKGGVTGHFTQVVWKDSKEVGFGVAFNGGFCISVGNYHPGGNFNNAYLQKVGNLIPSTAKSSKQLFDCSSAKKNALSQLNAIRKAHQVGELQLDETLCNYAMEHAESMGKTGTCQVFKINGQWKNWTNWQIMHLVRGSKYKGGEAIRKWYKRLEEYDFDKKCAKNSSDIFYINMGVALILEDFTKVGFGYYINDDNEIDIVAIFDGLVYNSGHHVYPATI